MDKGHFTVWQQWERGTRDYTGKWGYTYWRRGRCCFTSCHEYVSKRAAVRAVGRLGLLVDIFDTEGNWLQP